MSWAGFQGTYFNCSVAPLETSGITFTMEGTEELARTALSSGLDTLQPGEEKEMEEEYSDLNLWSFSNSGTGASCEIDRVPNELIKKLINC